MVIATVIFLTVMILFGMYLNRYHSYLDRDYNNRLGLDKMNKDIVHLFNSKYGLNLVDESDEIIAGDYRRLQQVKSND